MHTSYNSDMRRRPTCNVTTKMLLVLLYLGVLLVKVENNEQNNTKLPNAPESLETVVKSWYPDDTVVALLNGNETYRVQAKLRSVSEAFEDMLKFWFPDDAEFQESCVSEGCPALNNFTLCPNDINTTVLHSVMNTAIGCMRKPVCGILIDVRQTVAVKTTTEEWLPEMEIDGKATTLNGTDYLSNISNIEFELRPKHNKARQLPLQLTMFIPSIRYVGTIKLELRFLKMLSSIIGQPLFVNLPEVKYDVTVEYVSTMSINNSATHSTFQIKISNAIIKAHPTFCGLDTPDGFPGITTLFTRTTQSITDASSWAVRHSAFMEKYFSSVFRIVSNTC